MPRQVIQAAWVAAPSSPILPTSNTHGSSVMFGHTADLKALVVANATTGQGAWFRNGAWSAIFSFPVGCQPYGFSPVSQDGSSIGFFDLSRSSGIPTNALMICRPGSAAKPGIPALWGGSVPSSRVGSNQWSWLSTGQYTLGSPTGSAFLWFPGLPDIYWRCFNSNIVNSTSAGALWVGFGIKTGFPFGVIATDLKFPDSNLYQNGMRFYPQNDISGCMSPNLVQYAQGSLFLPQLSNGISNTIDLSGLLFGGSGGLWTSRVNLAQTHNFVSGASETSITGYYPVPHVLLTGLASQGMPTYNSGITEGWPVGILSPGELVAHQFALSTVGQLSAYASVRGIGGILQPVGFGTLRSVNYYQLADSGVPTGAINVAAPAGFSGGSNWAVSFVGSNPYLLDGANGNLYALSVLISEYDVISTANWSKKDIR